MSTELTTIYDYLYAAREDFNTISLVEKHVRWEEECEFAKQAIVRNERLQKCIPWTVQDAIKNVASIGLTLNPALGLAYLVPEYSKGLNGQECLLRLSSKGLVRLATDCGVIRLAKAEIVKELDEFTYNGIFELPTHKMNPFKDRGATIGVYCVAKLSTGEYITDVMDMAEIDKCKAAAKIKDVWVNWFEEMAKKSMIKRAQKQWPKSDGARRFEMAVAYDNDKEGLEPRDITPQEETQEEIHARLAEEIMEIKIGIDKGDLARAADAWFSLNDTDKSKIWVATTKGGCFTTKEREVIKTQEFRLHKPGIQQTIEQQ